MLRLKCHDVIILSLKLINNNIYVIIAFDYRFSRNIYNIFLR